MAYVKFSHPGVDLGLGSLLSCVLVVLLRGRLLVVGGRILLGDRRRAKPFSAKVAGAGAATAVAAGAAAGAGGAARRGRSAGGRVYGGGFSPTVVSVAADRRGGHGGARQRLRRRRVSGRRPVGVPGVGGGGAGVGVGAGAGGITAAASPLCGPPWRKVAGSRAGDAEVHTIVAVAAVPAGMHAGRFPELLAHGTRISIIM